MDNHNTIASLWSSSARVTSETRGVVPLEVGESYFRSSEIGLAFVLAANDKFPWRILLTLDSTVMYP